MRDLARKPQQQSAQIVSTPAPYKGLNDIDALAAMDPAYALILDNFIATPQGPSLRQGYRNKVTGFTTPITSYIVYNARSSASNKKFAVSGGAIYDTTTPGAVGAAVQSGLSTSNVYWQSVQQTYTTSNANYVIAVNGVDAPRAYNGAWTTCTQVATPTAPGQFSTVDNNSNAFNIDNFVDVALHQQRLWFVSNNSTIAYYCPIAQVGGSVSAFDFGPLFPRGGFLWKLATWTIDTGGAVGIQPLLVAISSKGDVVIFSGNNPATASTWVYVATYQLGTPIGRRCTTQLQGDLMYLSEDGLYPLSKYIQSARVDSTAALTYTISNTISQLVATFATVPGFEMAVFPGQNLMVLSIPGPSVANNVQYVFHTITKGWSRITGWPVGCLCLFNDNLYFGGTTSDCQAFIGYTDNAASDGSGGNNLSATALTAFTSFPDSIGDGPIKTVESVKPYIMSGQTNPAIGVTVNTDFDISPIFVSVDVNPVTGATWDGVNWDAPAAIWSGAPITFNQWFSPFVKPGNNLAFAISVSAGAPLTWSKTQWRINAGYEY